MPWSWLVADQEREYGEVSKKWLLERSSCSRQLDDLKKSFCEGETASNGFSHFIIIDTGPKI